MTEPTAAEVVALEFAQTWADGAVVLEDLTDDEAFWEPVADCWSVRRQAEASRAWGVGEWACEDDWPTPEPVPFTTIAWRIAHLAAWTDVYHDFTFGEARHSLNDAQVPGTADGLRGWLDDAAGRWGASLSTVRPQELFELRPAHWGARAPMVRLVTSITREYAHHLAEIGVFRDLRRGHAVRQPPPVVIDAPDWWQG